ncbi:MAG: glycosyltransferase [Phycisphaerae bacterium]
MSDRNNQAVTDVDDELVLSMSIGLGGWLALAGGIGSVWVVRTLTIHFALTRRQILHSDSYAGPPDNPPRVSVVVAAKDEEQDIDACVRTLLRQDYPDFEIIAVNDRSSDRTPQILERLQHESDGRLRVVTITALADGWFGKSNAMRAGVEASSGDWLWFTDADCRHTSTKTLSMAMSEALAHKVDFLSVIPVLEANTAWQRIVQPVCALVLLTWFLPEKVNHPLRTTAYANGAFMLISRWCYEALGGHERVRAKINEDIHLARTAKQMGLKLRVVENDDLYRTRMYRSARETWHGWSRIFFGCLETVPRLAAAACLVTLFAIVPWVSLAAAIAGRLLSPAEAASTWDLCAVAWACVIVPQQIVVWRFYNVVRVSPWWSVTYGLGAVLTLGILLNAILKAAGAATTTWRGTTYRADRVVDTSPP